MKGEDANFCDRNFFIGNLAKFRSFAKTVQDIFVSTLEHGDEGEDWVEESTGVGHQQLLVTHLQGRHK